METDCKIIGLVLIEKDEVERISCNTLGRDWSASGISIESLLDEIKALKSFAEKCIALGVEPHATWAKEALGEK